MQIQRLTKEQEIVKILFKEFLTHYNSRSISKVIGMSHVGAFKILKRLKEKGIVNSEKIGNTLVYSLNKENPVTIREIEMALTLEAQNYFKWIEEFKRIKEKSRFVILFGSILNNENSAKDIDLLVVADKKNFSGIKKLTEERKKFLNKKLHLLIQKPEEFKQDIENKNKIIIEVIKNGVILFGQEEIVKII